MPNISNRTLISLPIPLPPLDEQKRIVAVLDEAFEGLDRARANAEANLADARELWARLSGLAFESQDQGWKEATLGTLAEFRNGLNYTRSSNGDAIRIVGVGDFQSNTLIPIETLGEIVIDGKLSDDDRLKPDDIVAVRSNGNKALIGRVMMLPETEEVISFSGFTIRIRLVSDRLLPEYLLQFMRTPAVRETLTSGGGGSNISNLNQGQLSRLRIRFPSIEKQREILDRMDGTNAGFRELLDQYERQIADLADLRQSLLQKAFSGELG
ncbi:Type I restriction modification DNA specificity domain-containing protein [Rhodobacter capsulatus]|uniref:Type I restriction modification DNA specificity domain-containing protein n=2 Tax=Rhodobacter capsulatus TaxID=1061 RepID=A0A1G7SXY2_RHOCA|nr:Type I restriction modification DNA specificity domain-containing protein [Rhodobacter capsulatus]